MVIRQESIEQTIHRLRVFVHRFERRYECSSQTMLEYVLSGKTKETAEISKWLTTYRKLIELEKIGDNGRTIGTPMTPI